MTVHEDQPTMNIIPGFSSRRRTDENLPPGQYLTHDFPVLSAGPPRGSTPRRGSSGSPPRPVSATLYWGQLMDCPARRSRPICTCVTKWSKLGTGWEGRQPGHPDEKREGAGDFALVHSYGVTPTNLPVEDLSEARPGSRTSMTGSLWHPSMADPARLLVPHLYL